MLNKRDYRDLETGAGDWRVLTYSNPSRLCGGLPSSAFLPALPPLRRPSGSFPLLSCAPRERSRSGAKWPESLSQGAGPRPWLLWKCFLSLVRGLAQGIGKKPRNLPCSSAAHKHTFHVFCSLDSKILNWCFVVLFCFFFPLPYLSTSKAKRLGTGEATACSSRRHRGG